MSEGVDWVGGLRPTFLRIRAALGALRLWLFVRTISIFLIQIAFNQLLKISVEYMDEVTGPINQLALADILNMHNVDAHTVLRALIEYFCESDERST